jgi:predicted membrane protein
LVAEVVVRERKSDFAPVDRWLLGAGVIGSGAWMLHLTISYLLVPESCGDRSKWMLHVVTIFCTAATLFAAAIAWRIGAAETDERRRWTANLVLALCLTMMLVVIAQEIPNLILRSCD